MTTVIKIGEQYFIASEQGGQIQRISESDIVGRLGTGGSLDEARKSGDLIDVDPSKLTLQPAWMKFTKEGQRDYEGTVKDWESQGKPYDMVFNGQRIGLIQNQAQAQALGIPGAQLQPGGVIGTNQAYSEYLKSQPQALGVMSDQQGSTSVNGGQVTRDANDNIFIDGQHVALKKDLKPGDYPVAWEDLGFNVDFIPRGSTVSFNQAKTGQVPGTGTGSNTSGVGGTASSIDFNTPDWYKAAGLTDEQWKALDPSAQAFVQSTYQLLQGQYDQGLANVSINSDLLNKALVSAQTDPNIIAKYGDSLKLNQKGLQDTLAFIDQDYAQSTGLRGMKQESERKALAEQQSEAGRAYSGFRQQAERQLETEQGAVIASSRRELQNKINQLGQGLEQTYGTSGLQQFSPIQAGGLAYNPVGGITGTEAGQKQADIETRQTQIFNRERLT